MTADEQRVAGTPRTAFVLVQELRCNVHTDDDHVCAAVSSCHLARLPALEPDEARCGPRKAAARTGPKALAGGTTCWNEIFELEAPPSGALHVSVWSSGGKLVAEGATLLGGLDEGFADERLVLQDDEAHLVWLRVGVSRQRRDVELLRKGLQPSSVRRRPLELVHTEDTHIAPPPGLQRSRSNREDNAPRFVKSRSNRISPTVSPNGMRARTALPTATQHGPSIEETVSAFPMSVLRERGRMLVQRRPPFNITSMDAAAAELLGESRRAATGRSLAACGCSHSAQMTLLEACSRIHGDQTDIHERVYLVIDELLVVLQVHVEGRGTEGWHLEALLFRPGLESKARIQAMLEADGLAISTSDAKCPEYDLVQAIATPDVGGPADVSPRDCPWEPGDARQESFQELNFFEETCCNEVDAVCFEEADDMCVARGHWQDPRAHTVAAT